MTTYLIISTNETVRETQARTLAGQLNITSFDISVIETEGSIGIEDVRNLQKQIMLKPMHGENKAIIIKNAHMLTTEAQNALLKTLEEPPLHTYIYLTAENTNNLLPTILSRTSLIELNEDKQFDEQALQEIQEQVKILYSNDLGKKLKQAEVLAADKKEALIWIEKAMHTIRTTMLREVNQANMYIPVIESLQKTYTVLKTTNTNPRITLENLFLNCHSGLSRIL